jgi:hypothetical protein
VGPTKIKSKKIIFRVEESLYDFISKFSRASGMTMSELIRNVLIYFHTGYLLGEFTQTMPELEKKFHREFSSKKKTDRFFKKFKPRPLSEQMGKDKYLQKVI